MTHHNHGACILKVRFALDEHSVGLEKGTVTGPHLYAAIRLFFFQLLTCIEIPAMSSDGWTSHFFLELSIVPWAGKRKGLWGLRDIWSLLKL